MSNNPLDSKEFLERLRREWADSCNALLPGYAVIDHRSFKARGIERIPTIHEGYASREMEKRGGRGDLCEENRRIQALNRLRRLRAELGRDADGSDGSETSVRALHAAEQVREALAYVRAVEKRLRAVQRLLVADAAAADNNDR